MLLALSKKFVQQSFLAWFFKGKKSKLSLVASEWTIFKLSVFIVPSLAFTHSGRHILVFQNICSIKILLHSKNYANLSKILILVKLYLNEHASLSYWTEMRSILIVLYFQIRPWIWKITLCRSKCSRRLLSDGTSCPYLSNTEPERRSIFIYPLLKNTSLYFLKHTLPKQVRLSLTKDGSSWACFPVLLNRNAKYL